MSEFERSCVDHSREAMAMADEQVLKTLEESTINAHRLQLQVLKSILDLNSTTAYLGRHLHGHVADADSFRRLVPLSSYEDYAETIRSIARGEAPPSDLSLDRLLCFFYSSGTGTMRPKLIPFFDSALARDSSNLAHQASSALLRRLFPPRPSTNKILWFLYAGNVTETKGGFKVMAASAYPFHRKGPSPSPLLSMCISPPEVILGSVTEEQTFCHLLCGLKDSAAIDAIRAPYAATLVRAFRILKSKWEQLCDCIERGSVSLEITDLVMRDAVNNFLGAPRADLAKRIRGVCSRDDWYGILKKLWPDLRYISCVTTGSMEQYYPILQYYAGESVTLLCGDYFASECSIGINMDRAAAPRSTSFVILPTAAYFEFLPFELGASSTAKGTVDISGVEIGKMYEVVVTTYRGLYRYRLGDIVKIVGLHNSSPRVEFVTRAPKGDSEVFTERDLMSAMEGLKQVLRDELQGEVVEYAGFLDQHLIVFLEVNEHCDLLKMERLEDSIAVLRRCSSVLEGCMGSLYHMKREIGILGPVEIAVVRPTSFDDIAKMALESGAPSNQYKPPKILRNVSLIESLKASVVVSVSLDGQS